MAKEASFEAHIVLGLKFLHDHPSALEFLEKALTRAEASLAAGRWKLLIDMLTVWDSPEVSSAITFFMRSKSGSFPDRLSKQFPAETSRLRELKALFGEMVTDSYAADQNPFSLQTIEWNLKAGEGPVNFVRADRHNVSFMFRGSDVNFLSSTSLYILEEALSEGWELGSKERTRLIDLVSGVLELLRSEPQQ